MNAVVVGSGAGGGVIAKELAEAGLSVVLLERGRTYTGGHFSHDELDCQCQSGRPLAYGPAIEPNPRTFRYADTEKVRTVYPGWDSQYARLTASVGGATIAYGGASWRFMPQDFRMRSTYGVPEGTTLEDWPVTYEDLEPFYEKAEYELGVCGLAGADPFAGPRKKPYPLPPLPSNPQGELLAAAGKRLGWHPFPPPFAILTQPYQGRNACVQCAWCLGYVCEVDAKSSTAVTVIPRALKTGHCELRTGCYVNQILTDSRGRASGVTYFDFTDSRKPAQRQDADLVVVAASAIETPRLLLNSRSKLFPQGLANSSGQVGRNLMSHIYAGAFGIFEKEIPHDLGPGPSIAFNDWNHPRDRPVVGGAYIYNFYTTLPIRFANNRPPGEPTWGKAHKDFQRKYFRRYIHLDSGCQDMPFAHNRVDLDPEVRDGWGVPVARITHHYEDIDFRASDFVIDRQEELLKEAGAIRTWRVRHRRGGVGDHQNGTCRMGNDPKTSVLNRYCQAHEVDNLFVTDGSCFVTSAGFNPALTIQALAYWCADYIKRERKGGAFRSRL